MSQRLATVLSVRIGTANLLHGRSLVDGLVDTDRMAQAIADLATSVIGIQEVDRNQARSGNTDQTAAIAERIAAGGAESVAYRFAPAIIGEPGARWTAATGTDPVTGHDTGNARPTAAAYGVGMISVLPVESWHVVRLPAAPVRSPILLPGTRRPILLPDEPRVALIAVMCPGVAPFRTVATTHLSFVPGWNVRQFRMVRNALATFPGPRLLLGDLNLPSAVVSRTSGRWEALAHSATYPSANPRIQFDHVLTDSPTVGRDATCRSVAMTISDHRALLVDLRP